MSKLRATMSISLDGYGAGPHQSLEEPLGVGGEHLHDWMFPLDVFKEMHGDGTPGETNASSDVVEGLVGERRRHRHGPEDVRRRSGSLARRLARLVG